MQSNPLLPSLPGPVWSKVVAADRVLFMGQIELNCTYGNPMNGNKFGAKYGNQENIKKIILGKVLELEEGPTVKIQLDSLG